MISGWIGEFLTAQGWQPWVALVLLVLLLAGLMKSSIPPDGLMLGVAVLGALLGIISPDDVFSGFANTGMLTVAALFVVAAGLRETGVLDAMGRWLLGSAQTERQALWRIAGSTTVISAFLNNTPIVAMFIPIVTGWCKQRGVAPSKLLMPLSFLTVLGGCCTLIGTSTNLLVNGLMEKSGIPGMSLFELSWAGVPMAIVGTLYLVFIGSRLLPNRSDLIQQFGESRREYLVNMRVTPGSGLVNKTVQDAGLRRLPGLFLIEIDREGEVLSPVRPDQRIEAGDVLTFTGLVDTIVDLERIPGLVPVTEQEAESAADRRERMLQEAVISSTSPLIGKSIRDAEFRGHYNAAVLAVHRGGERLQGRVGDIELKGGDTLLLQTGPHFDRAHRNNADFYLVSPVQDARPVRHDRAVFSLVLMVLLIAMMATDVIDTVLAAFFVAGLMIMSRCVSMNTARQSIEWQTLIVIGAAFGVSEVMQQSGLVKIVAEAGVHSAEAYGPIAILATIYLMTLLVTELVTNNAAAALMFPFSIAIADTAGLDVRPFIIAITLAASAAFATPIGYQTHLMVYGPGGYQFSDFVKVGVPLNFICFVVAIIVIPMVWPF